jgi:hypothetical protein
MMRVAGAELNFSVGEFCFQRDFRQAEKCPWFVTVYSIPDIQLRAICQLMKRALIIVVILVAVLYAVDFLSLRFGIPARDPVGSVTVHTFYAVKLKNGKTEYDYYGDHDVSCTNSVFPQYGLKPCWWASRHTNEQIKIDSGNPNNPSLF